VSFPAIFIDASKVGPAGAVTATGTGTGASGRLARLTIGHRLGRLLAADDRGALVTAGAQRRDGRPADLTGAAVSNTWNPVSSFLACLPVR
jgi:hypothetical protein